MGIAVSEAAGPPWNGRWNAPRRRGQAGDSTSIACPYACCVGDDGTGDGAGSDAEAAGP